MHSNNGSAISRRHLLGAGAVAMAGSVINTGSTAAQSESAASPAMPSEFVIKGGYVISVDPDLGDLAVGDVHVRDGLIVDVAEGMDIAGVETLDATNCIVMPGFIETHWHMWNSIWRGMADDATAYFALGSLSSSYTPEDHYAAVRYAALEAISAGITTCHNWAHGVDSADDVVAEMQALSDSGIRATMAYPAVLGGQPVPREALQDALDWIEANGAGRLKLSMILDGAGDLFAQQVELARQLQLRPITDHGAFLGHPELLGPEFILTHGTGLTKEQAAALAPSGLKFGLCPGTDPMIGAGLPPIVTLLMGGVPLENISITADVTAQTPADPFAMLRTLVNSGRIQQAASTDLLGIVKAANDWQFSYRDAIRVGTSSGANVLGLADRVGTLTPGKRADLIVVRTDELNMLPAPNTNPAFQLIQHGLPSNVDTVVVDGRVLKRSGKLVGVDVAGIVAAAASSQAAIRQRAGLPPLDLSI